MKYYNIPIFVPHEGCPYNCIFCNQKRITGADTSVTAADIVRIIEEHLKTLPETDRYIEAAFFGGSFTGISAEKQEEFLSAAYKYVLSGKIDGIRMSTRPDYIDTETIARLKKYGVTTVELGVQSMDSEVLRLSARGHTADDVEKAAKLIKDADIRLGLQMMTGLPGDTPEKSIETARHIIALKPDCVRIYPTLVVRDTPLETMYKNGTYKPQPLDEAVQLCKKLLLMFDEAKIDVIRVALVTTDEISDKGSVIAGPFHSAFRELCEGEIYFDMMCGMIEKEKITGFYANPREISKVVGNRRRNVKRIKEKYNIDIKIKPLVGIEKGKLRAWKE